MSFWIIAALAAFLLGLSKGGVPMIAILAVPLLSLYMDPILAAGLLLPVYLIGDVYAIYLFRKSFSRANLRILIPAAALGTLIAMSTITIVSVTLTKLLLGGIGLGYLFSALWSRHFHRTRPKASPHWGKGMFWGTIAGFTSYVAHAAAPPYQAYILPQRLEKFTYLGTTTILFFAMNIMKLPAYIYVGQMDWSSTKQSLVIAPFALLGAWCGLWISRHLPEKIFFLFVEFALFVISLRLIYEAV